jgi:hypothetical protein
MKNDFFNVIKSYLNYTPNSGIIINLNELSIDELYKIQTWKYKTSDIIFHNVIRRFNQFIMANVYNRLSNIEHILNGEIKYNFKTINIFMNINNSNMSKNNSNSNNSNNIKKGRYKWIQIIKTDNDDFLRKITWREPDEDIQKNKIYIRSIKISEFDIDYLVRLAVEYLINVTSNYYNNRNVYKFDKINKSEYDIFNFIVNHQPKK